MQLGATQFACWAGGPQLNQLLLAPVGLADDNVALGRLPQPPTTPLGLAGSLGSALESPLRDIDTTKQSVVSSVDSASAPLIAALSDGDIAIYRLDQTVSQNYDVQRPCRPAHWHNTKHADSDGDGEGGGDDDDARWSRHEQYICKAAPRLAWHARHKGRVRQVALGSSTRRCMMCCERRVSFVELERPDKVCVTHDVGITRVMSGGLIVAKGIVAGAATRRARDNDGIH